MGCERSKILGRSALGNCFLLGSGGASALSGGGEAGLEGGVASRVPMLEGEAIAGGGAASPYSIINCNASLGNANDGNSNRQSRRSGRGHGDGRLPRPAVQRARPGAGPGRSAGGVRPTSTSDDGLAGGMVREVITSSIGTYTNYQSKYSLLLH